MKKRRFNSRTTGIEIRHSDAGIHDHRTVIIVEFFGITMATVEIELSDSVLCAAAKRIVNGDAISGKAEELADFAVYLEDQHGAYVGLAVLAALREFGLTAARYQRNAEPVPHLTDHSLDMGVMPVPTCAPPPPPNPAPALSSEEAKASARLLADLDAIQFYTDKGTQGAD